MSHTLQRLFHQLEHGILPVESFYMYRGTDWKQHVHYINGNHPFVTQLCKSNNFTLFLKTWQQGQYEKTNFHTIHSRLLQGQLSMNEDDKETTLFSTAKPHLVQPYKTLVWTAKEPSVSLQLYYNPSQK